ncbi:LEA type 2 family protein [Myxococcota bacterium]|nr:LEA type 2 family protein [Myxococcota bacterium]
MNARTLKLAPALVLVAALNTACEDFDVEPYMPTVTFSELRVNDVDWDGIESDFVFNVNNPNPLTINLDRFNYSLAFEEVEWLSGDSPDGLELAAADASELALPVSLEFETLFEMVQAVRGEDDIGFGLQGSFGFDTDLGPVDLPYSEDGGFPAPRRPTFSLEKLKVKDISFTGADLNLRVNVDNDHGSNLFFQDVNFAVNLAGVDVGGGFLADLGDVGAGASTQTVNFPITVNFLDVGTAIYDVLQGEKLEVGFAADMDVDSPFGLIPLAVAETKRIEIER